MFMRLVAVLVAGAFCAAHAAEPSLLFKDVTLIDGTGTPPLEHAYVLVVGETDVANGTVGVNARGQQVERDVPVGAFVARLTDEVASTSQV